MIQGTSNDVSELVGIWSLHIVPEDSTSNVESCFVAKFGVIISLEPAKRTEDPLCVIWPLLPVTELCYLLTYCRMIMDCRHLPTAMERIRQVAATMARVRTLRHHVCYCT